MAPPLKKSCSAASRRTAVSMCRSPSPCSRMARWVKRDDKTNISSCAGGLRSPRTLVGKRRRSSSFVALPWPRPPNQQRWGRPASKPACQPASQPACQHLCQLASDRPQLESLLKHGERDPNRRTHRPAHLASLPTKSSPISSFSPFSCFFFVPCLLACPSLSRPNSSTR